MKIVRDKKGYKADGKRIETAMVEAFLDAVDEPDAEKPTMESVGISQEWLDSNALPAAKEYAGGFIELAAKNQVELFLSTFRDSQKINGEALIDFFRGGWTDDYPRIKITIREIDGTTIVVSSDSQPVFMLPWSIERGGKSKVNYNARISRTLSALLPKNFTNRERIAGEGFRAELAERIMRMIEPEWEMLDAENKAGPALAVLKRDFHILSAEVNFTHGLDFGKEWVNGNSDEKNLQATLRPIGEKTVLTYRLILVHNKGDVLNLDLFQADIGKYRELVFSVPWLRAAIESGGYPVAIRFVRDASLSPKALERFMADMQKIGRPELALEVEKNRREIALISVGGGLDYYNSYWLVMPDHRVILWRFRYTFFFKWKEADFKVTECSGNIPAKCVGAVIYPNGELAR
ncbi:MAG: hypothetical protein IPN69_06210 [Acidobacteria bacterium]|nr:hypothetical protein [Acidobacteriota bacterium]